MPAVQVFPQVRAVVRSPLTTLARRVRADGRPPGPRIEAKRLRRALRAVLSGFEQHLGMAPRDVQQLERGVGWRPGVGLPGLDGSRADVEQPGERDLGDSKASPDFGHIARSELRQRTEFDFARRQYSLPAVVRDRVLESSAELG